jgi:hypothetical protein
MCIRFAFTNSNPPYTNSNLYYTNSSRFFGYKTLLLPIKKQKERLYSVTDLTNFIILYVFIKTFKNYYDICFVLVLVFIQRSALTPIFPNPLLSYAYPTHHRNQAKSIRNKP